MTVIYPMVEHTVSAERVNDIVPGQLIRVLARRVWLTETGDYRIEYNLTLYDERTPLDDDDTPG